MYNAARQLYLQLVQSTQKCPINIKRGKLAQIELKIQAVMEDTAFANAQIDNPQARLKWLSAALEKMEEVCVSIRVIHDLHYITPKGFNAITNKEDHVLKQLKAWQRSTLNNA